MPDTLDLPDSPLSAAGALAAGRSSTSSRRILEQSASLGSLPSTPSSPKRSWDDRLVCMVDAAQCRSPNPRQSMNDHWVPPRLPQKRYYRKAAVWPLDNFQVEEHPELSFQPHEEPFLARGQSWYELAAPGQASYQKKLGHQARNATPLGAAVYHGRHGRTNSAPAGESRSMQVWRDSVIYASLNSSLRGGVRQAMHKRIFDSGL